MSSASKIFDKKLRAIVLEGLRSDGFVFDGSRTFRRTISDKGIMHIINFQLGQRAREGEFTVNLGVYVPSEADAHTRELNPLKVMEFHCTMKRRERLGCLLPSRLHSLQHVPYLGFLFGSKDRWWRFSADSKETEASLSSVMAAIETHGLPWLSQMMPNPPINTEADDKAARAGHIKR